MSKNPHSKSAFTRFTRAQKVEITRVFRLNNEARVKYGRIAQDGECCLKGEVFYKSLTQVEFDDLEFLTKRQDGLARDFRGGLYKRDYKYALIFGEQEVFEVYVQKHELERLGIKYQF